MRYLPVILGALLVLVVSCTPPTTLEKPSVTTAAIENGAKLRLTWTAVSGATGYNVYLDGAKTAVASGSYSFDVPQPTKLIEVSATASSEESDKWSLNTMIVKTASFIVYSMGDAGQQNKAFFFNSTGTAIPIPLSQVSDIDFIADTTGASIELRAPTAYTPHYNEKDNATAAAVGTMVFDDYKTAEAPGSGVYLTARTITTNALYSFWIDPNGSGWTVDDHFGKLKIESISGTAVTMTAGYQMVGGLRWLISN